MMDSQPHAGICREKLRGRKQEGLPRALRSSSKFSLLFIFQVPAKLGMSAEAECRELLKEPVPRWCDAFLCPLWLFLTLLLFPCAPVPPLLTLTLKMQVCFWASFKCMFLLTRSHLHSVSLCTGSRLVFIAPVLNGRRRAPTPPKNAALLLWGQDCRFCFGCCHTCFISPEEY